MLTKLGKVTGTLDHKTHIKIDNLFKLIDRGIRTYAASNLLKEGGDSTISARKYLEEVCKNQLFN